MTPIEQRWYNGKLQVRFKDSNWQSYESLPNTLKKPDYQIKNGSKGYATMQYLLSIGVPLAQSVGLSTSTDNTDDPEVVEAQQKQLLENYEVEPFFDSLDLPLEQSLSLRALSIEVENYTNIDELKEAFLAMLKLHFYQRVVYKSLAKKG